MNPVKNIRIMCPNLKCRSILVVPETARGKNVKCSNCTTLFKIPTQAPTPPTPAAAAAKH
jgi:LSD1 subclass zinc finger protein